MKRLIEHNKYKGLVAHGWHQPNMSHCYECVQNNHKHGKCATLVFPLKKNVESVGSGLEYGKNRLIRYNILNSVS